MCFDELMTDTIFIIKGGEQYGPFKASVNKGHIDMAGNLLTVRAGDTVIRQLSNGGQERYTVIDPCYYEDFGPIGAHYELKVRKEDLLSPACHEISHITIRGDNNRLNINSNDNSINIKTAARLQSLIDELREAVDASEMSESDRSELMDIVEEIREKACSSKPNKKLVQALLDSLPATDNVLSIASSIMSFFV